MEVNSMYGINVNVPAFVSHPYASLTLFTQARQERPELQDKNAQKSARNTQACTQTSNYYCIHDTSGVTSKHDT